MKGESYYLWKNSVSLLFLVLNWCAMVELVSFEGWWRRCRPTMNGCFSKNSCYSLFGKIALLIRTRKFVAFRVHGCKSIMLYVLFSLFWFMRMQEYNFIFGSCTISRKPKIVGSVKGSYTSEQYLPYMFL